MGLILLEMAGASPNLTKFPVGSLNRTEEISLIIFSTAPYLSLAHQSGPLHGYFLLITKVRQSFRLSPQNSPAKALGKIVPTHLVQWKNIWRVISVIQINFCPTNDIMNIHNFILRNIPWVFFKWSILDNYVYATYVISSLYYSIRISILYSLRIRKMFREAFPNFLVLVLKK